MKDAGLPVGRSTCESFDPTAKVRSIPNFKALVRAIINITRLFRGAGTRTEGCYLQ